MKSLIGLFNNFDLSKILKDLGTTEDIKKSGFILPDGKMLDMSGGSDSREFSHSETLKPYSDKSYLGSFELINDFGSESRSMRVNFNKGSDAVYLQIWNIPSKQQMNRIKDNLGSRKIFLDFGSESKTYNDFESFKKSLESLDSFDAWLDLSELSL